MTTLAASIDLTSLLSGLAGLVGAGIFAGISKLYRTWKKQNRKDKAQQQDLDRLRERVQQLEADKKAQDRRIDELEARLERERERRRAEEKKAEQLEQKLNVVLRLFNDRRQQEGKERLSVPQITLMALEDGTNDDVNNNDTNS